MIVNSGKTDTRREITDLSRPAELVRIRLNCLQRGKTLIGVQHSRGSVNSYAARFEKGPSERVSQPGPPAAGLRQIDRITRRGGIQLRGCRKRTADAVA